MTTPWLDIPLADYEAHMALPSVAQAQLLSEAFRQALDRYRPRSLALLGCAGGNGLEHVPPSRLDRVVALDVNPAYVDELRARWGSRIPRLETVVADVAAARPSFEPVDLAFAGLLLEYVKPSEAMPHIRSMVRLGGTLVTVVQSPSDTTAEITPSPYTSLRALAPRLRLVPPERVTELAEEQGFRRIEERSLDARGGKRLVVQTFAAAS